MRKREFLLELLKSHQGRIIAHNLVACVRNGRLDKKRTTADGRKVRDTLRALVQSAEAKLNAKKPAVIWAGVDSLAVQCFIDTVRETPARWRFLGRELVDLKCHIAVLMTREKLIENTVAEVIDNDKLAWGGVSRDVPTTKALCRAFADGVDTGSLALRKGMIGATFGVFWAAPKQDYEEVQGDEGAWASLCAERAGLYHLSERKFKSHLFIFKSTKTLQQLAKSHKFKPSAPTPIEALHNFRFLAADIPKPPPKGDWGSALNMGAFRYQLDSVKDRHLQGLREVCLPAMRFRGNFKLHYFGELPETLTGTDEQYRKILDRVFKPVSVKGLRDAFA